MTGGQPANTSGTARLLLGAPSYEVGWQEPVYVPNPAAGASFTYKSDGRYYERVLAVTFALTTSAAVANRFAQLYLKDANGAVVTSVPCGGTVVAATTLSVNLFVGAPTLANSASGGSWGSLPDLLIPPGWQWALTVFGEDVADQVSGIVLLVQRFPNDAVEIQANA